ncbi:MAG: hypothetical protein WBA51_09015 [Erythrobacter sp.]
MKWFQELPNGMRALILIIAAVTVGALILQSGYTVGSATAKATQAEETK